MAKFHVKETFRIKGRKYYFLAGSIVEGEVGIGMLLRLPARFTEPSTVRIEQIEFARRGNGLEDTCLCVVYPASNNPEEWFRLDIEDEILEITTDDAN